MRIEISAKKSWQRALRRCRSQEEVVLAARRLGYRMTRQDLAAAVEEHRGKSDVKTYTQSADRVLFCDIIPPLLADA